MTAITVPHRLTTRLRAPGQRWAVLLVLLAALPPFHAGSAEEAAAPAPPDTSALVNSGPAQSAPSPADLARFLDRLMLVESGGRDDARNRLSTAVGPYQFIESTFLDIAQRHFHQETHALGPTEVLKLRTNRAFARKAAEAFTRDNAFDLSAADIQPSFANLRLAFLVGAAGAIRVLEADPQTPIVAVLGRRVVSANPKLAGMSAGDLARWSARNIAMPGIIAGDWDAKLPSAAITEQAGISKPTLAIRCKQALASCRRWVSLASKRLEGPQAANAQRAGKPPRLAR